LGSDIRSRLAFGRAGRERVCEHFDKNVQFGRFLDEFEQIVARREARSP